MRYLFNRLDLNGDGVLDAAELTALVGFLLKLSLTLAIISS